jgi:hypothetical protein
MRAVGSRSGAHFAVKPTRVFCDPAVFLTVSDTQVYLDRQCLAGIAKPTRHFTAENKMHAAVSLAGSAYALHG